MILGAVPACPLLPVALSTEAGRESAGSAFFAHRAQLREIAVGEQLSSFSASSTPVTDAIAIHKPYRKE